jgi:SAM-dependent methyltransferase
VSTQRPERSGGPCARSETHARLRRSACGDGFADHFSERSDAYAAFRPTYPPALAAALAGLVPRHELAWDAGCGSGQLSIGLAEHFDAVVATDASAAQIAAAAPHPRVTYRDAAAEASGLADAGADLAVAAQAAHWFDLDAWYAEVRRVVRPGGAVALVSYGRVRLDGAVDDLLARFHGETLASAWPPERRHVDAAYATLPFPFPPLAVPPLAIRSSLSLAELAGYVETWSAVRALGLAGRRAEADAFLAGLRAAWGDPALRRAARFPLAVLAGRL